MLFSGAKAASQPVANWDAAMPISVRYPFAGQYEVTQTPSGNYSHTDDPTNGTDPDYWVAAYDFALPEGTPVLSMAPGIVVDYRQGGDPSHGLGSFVTILHYPRTEDEFYATYAHLSADSIPFEPDDRGFAWVEAGERIGLSGDTGAGTGPHLHVQFGRTDFTHHSGDILAYATDSNDLLIDFNGVTPAAGDLVTGADEGIVSGNDDTGAVNDFDGNGTSDVLWWNETTGSVGLYLMEDGSLPAMESLTLQDPDTIILATGDFYGDGTSNDILCANGFLGRVTILQVDNDGGLSVHGYGHGSGSPDWKVVGVGDFDGNGIDDVLSRHVTSGAIGVTEIDGQLALSWQVVGGATLDWNVAGSGDFDGDGKDDILWQNGLTGVVGMFEMEDDAPAWQAFEATTLDWAIIGTGDFNGDGSDEILFRNGLDGRIGTFRIENDVITRQAIGAASFDWEVSDIGDFNGDGTDDILFRHDPSGAVGMFEMDNGDARWESIGWESTVLSIQDHAVDDFLF